MVAFALDLPNPGIELRSPALQVDSLPVEPPGKPYVDLFAISIIALFLLVKSASLNLFGFLLCLKGTYSLQLFLYVFWYSSLNCYLFLICFLS